MDSIINPPQLNDVNYFAEELSIKPQSNSLGLFFSTQEK